MKLINLSNDELLKLDDSIHAKAYTDENLISHMDMITEIQARGLKHTDESNFSKATNWWLLENPRFSGSISLWEVEEELPGISLEGAIRKRGVVGPNEYINVVVVDNTEAVNLISKCHRPEIMSRLDFRVGNKPLQPEPWPQGITVIGKNALWHKFAGSRISKGLWVFPVIGEDITIIKNGDHIAFFDDQDRNVDERFGDMEEEGLRLPDGVYFGNFQDQIHLVDFTKSESKCYMDRFEELKKLVVGLTHFTLQQYTPATTLPSLEKSMVGESLVLDPESNDRAYVYDPKDDVVMDVCKFGGDSTVCKITQGAEQPINCFLGDTYICPYVKDIYYEE